MNTELLLRLQTIFREVFQIPGLIISSSTSPSDIPAWNSLNHVRVIAAVEKDFNFRFSLEELMEISHVGDIIRILSEKVNQ
jgi:acyl carrier protein